MKISPIARIGAFVKGIFAMGFIGLMIGVPIVVVISLIKWALS